MKVTRSEISKGFIRNPRMASKGLIGGVITFNSTEKVVKGDIYTLNHNDRDRYYKVEEVVAIDNINVEVAAVEYGYWGYKLSRCKDFDVRDLVGVSVTRVLCEKQLNQLHESNSYC